MKIEYIGRVFDDRARFAVDFQSQVCTTRAEAARTCFDFRPKAQRCMVSEAHDGVATHNGIQWVDRPRPRPKRSWLLALRLIGREHPSHALSPQPVELIQAQP